MFEVFVEELDTIFELPDDATDREIKRFIRRQGFKDFSDLQLPRGADLETDPYKLKGPVIAPSKLEPSHEKFPEKDFQNWYKSWAQITDINQDPDDPKHKYDYRAAFKAGAEPSIEEDGKFHWPSQFKALDHPTRFQGGFDTATGKPLSVQFDPRHGLMPGIPGEVPIEMMEFPAPPAPEKPLPSHLKVAGKGVILGLEQAAAGLGAEFRWLGDVMAEMEVNSLKKSVTPTAVKLLKEKGTPLMTAGKWLSDQGIKQSKFWRDQMESGFAALDPRLTEGPFAQSPSTRRAVAIIAQAFPSMAIAVAGSVITGSPLLGAAAMTLPLEAAPAYEEAREKGVGFETASGVGVATLIGTTLLEYLALDSIMKGRGGFIYRMFAGAEKEASQEAAQTVFQNLVVKVGYDGSRQLSEGIIEAMIGGAGAGGGAGAIIRQAKESGVTDREIITLKEYLEEEIQALAGSLDPGDQLYAAARIAIQAGRTPQGDPFSIEDLGKMKGTQLVKDLGLEDALNGLIIEATINNWGQKIEKAPEPVEEIEKQAPEKPEMVPEPVSKAEPIPEVKAEAKKAVEREIEPVEAYKLEGQTPEEVEAEAVKRLEKEKAEAAPEPTPTMEERIRVIAQDVSGHPTKADLDKAGKDLGAIQNEFAQLERDGIIEPGEEYDELYREIRSVRTFINYQTKELEAEVAPEPEPEEPEVETVFVNWPKAGDLPIEGAEKVGQKTLQTGRGKKTITHWRIGKDQLSAARDAGATLNKNITEEAISREEAEEAIRRPIKPGKLAEPKPGQRPATPKEFNAAKDKFLKEVDKAIKKAEDVTALRDVEEAGLVKFVDPFGAEFEVHNIKDALRTFKRVYKAQVKRTPDKIVKKKPSKPSVTKPSSKESYGPEVIMIKDAPEPWFTDGAIAIKQGPGKPIKPKENKGYMPDLKMEWEAFINDFVIPEKDLTDAALIYYTSPGEAGVDFSVGKDPVVQVAEGLPLAVFKAGNKFYGYNQNIVNIITNRYPDAEFKINAREAPDMGNMTIEEREAVPVLDAKGGLLQAYDRGELVAVHAQIRGGQDPGALGIPEARDFGLASIKTKDVPTVTASISKLADDVMGWIAKVVPKQFMPHITKVTLTPQIELDTEDIRKSAEELGLEPEEVPIKDIAGFTFLKPLSAAIQIATEQGRDEMEDTAYHEAFHVATGWLLPDAERAKLLEYYGNEEKAADAFAKWTKKELAPKPPTKISAIFQRLRRTLEAIYKGLQGRGFKSPEDVFKAILGQEYTEFQPIEIRMARVQGRADIKKDGKPARDAAEDWIEAALKSQTVTPPGETVKPLEEADKEASVLEEDPNDEEAYAEVFSEGKVSTWLSRFTNDKGKLDLGKIFNETGIDLPTDNPKDLLKYVRQIQTMQDLAKNYPQMRALLDTELKKEGDSNQANIQDRAVTEPYYDLSRKSKNLVNDALLEGDRTNKLFSNEVLKNKFGLNDKERAGYWAMRRILNDKLRLILNNMIGDAVSAEQAPEIVEAIQKRNNAISRGRPRNKLNEAFKSTLAAMELDEKQISQMMLLASWAFKRRAYVPHDWNSAWIVNIEDEDGQKVQFEVPTIRGKIPIRSLRGRAAQRAAHQLIKKKLGWSDTRIKALAGEGKIVVVKATDVPGDLFEKANVGTVASIIDAATEKIANRYERDLPEKEQIRLSSLRKSIQEMLEELYLAKGWGRHLIPRKEVRGYRKDLDKVIPQYLIGFNSFQAKASAARSFAEVMKSINPLKTPELWKHGREYIEDMLGPPKGEARPFKRMVSLFYLAADISNATLNMTQNWTHGIAALRMVDSDVLAEKELARAMKDVTNHYRKERFRGKTIKEKIKRKRIFEKAEAGITKAEIDAMRRAYDRGQLDPIYFGDVSGVELNRVYVGYLSKMHRMLYLAFTGSESLNRMSTFLAVYRRAERAKAPTPAATAARAVETAHFLYGRGNRPALVRKAGLVGNALYTFMTYPLGNITFLKHRIEDVFHAQTPKEKRRAKKVLGSNLAYVMAFGGLQALPFAFLARFVWGLFSDDDDWMNKYNPLKEKTLYEKLPNPIARGVTRGIPAVFGSDMSWKVEGTDVFGAPIGYQTAKSIYRRVRWQGIEPIQRGEHWHALFMGMPDFLMNPYKAFFAEAPGTGYRGQPLIEYTPSQKVYKALGFAPTEESEARAAQRETFRARNHRLKVLKKLVDDYLRADRNNDWKAKVKVLQRRKAYNEKTDEKGLHITKKQFLNYKSRLKKQKERPYQERVPKYMKKYHEKTRRTYGLKG